MDTLIARFPKLSIAILIAVLLLLLMIVVQEAITNYTWIKAVFFPADSVPVLPAASTVGN